MTAVARLCRQATPFTVNGVEAAASVSDGTAERLVIVERSFSNRQSITSWHPQATPFAAPGLPRLWQEDSAQLNDCSSLTRLLPLFWFKCFCDTLQATPFAAPGLPRLSREDSAQLGDLSLDADDIVEEALARRSNSGPLSRSMLEVRVHSGH